MTQQAPKVHPATRTAQTRAIHGGRGVVVGAGARASATRSRSTAAPRSITKPRTSTSTTATTTASTRSATIPRSITQTATGMVTSSSSSTSTSTTTPWVRKFLAGRPKDRLLPLPKDYISDNFNLAQLPPIVERAGFEAMGDDSIPVAKALQHHRITVAAAAAAVATGQSKSSSSISSTSYPIYRRALRRILNDEGEQKQEDATNHQKTTTTTTTTTTITDKNEEDLIIPSYAIQKAAEALYLMIHARFVISPRGLEAIRQVMTVDNTVFGKCPRSTCRGTGLLPYGYSNDYTTRNAAAPTTTTSTHCIPTTTTKEQQHYRSSASGSSFSSTTTPAAAAAAATTATTTAKSSCCHRYCPSCGEVWIAWDSKTDGCAWGPSWCHLFLLAFGTQVYAKELADATTAAVTSASSCSINRVVSSSLSSLSSSSSYNTNTSSSSSSRPIPSIFGFRIHPATSFGRPLNKPSSLF